LWRIATPRSTGPTGSGQTGAAPRQRSWASGVRHREEELGRAFFSSRFVRVLGALGFARFGHWRLYGEQAMAGSEAAPWLAAERLTLEHAREPLSRYEVRIEPDTGRLRSVGRQRLFETACSTPRPRLFTLNAPGEGGWLKAMRLEGYATRSPAVPRVCSRRCSSTTRPGGSLPVCQSCQLPTYAVLRCFLVIARALLSI
jgi:hypothetical protein